MLLLFQTPVVLLLAEPRVGKVPAKRLEGNSSQPAGGAGAAAEMFLLFRLARQPTAASLLAEAVGLAAAITLP